MEESRLPAVAERMSFDSSRGSLEPLDHRIDDAEANAGSQRAAVQSSATENGTQDANSESSTSDTITQSAPAYLGQTNETRSSEGSVSEVTDSGAPGGADEATPEEDDDEAEDSEVCWKRSRCVKIEKRAEGFGFTLRNVVMYPSNIHKIAAALGKRPKDVEPSWVEGKPLDAVLVREVRESGAAQSAGLRPGDRIVAHEGCPIESYSNFVARIHQCSTVLEVTVISGADDPLSCGLWASGLGLGLSRSVNTVGVGVLRPVQRSHWLSSSLAPRPYLSTYQRVPSTQPRSLPNHSLIHSSPINQSTVSLTESTTGGSVSGAESEMSLSMPSIPLPPSCSVPSQLDSTLKPQRKKRRDKNKTKHNKKDLKRMPGQKDEESRSSSLSSLGPPSPAGTTSVAAKLQLFEGGQGFLARSMEKLKLYRSELTRMASPPPNTVQVRTAQFEKVNFGAASDKKGTTSPPPGATLKKLKTLFTEKSTGCAVKVLRCPEVGKKVDHSWRPAEILTETVDGRLRLKIITDKDSINLILNRLVRDSNEANLRVDFATMDFAKRRKNVLRVSSGASASLASVMRDCALCPDKDSEYEFLIQCDTPVTVHNICSVINASCSESIKTAPSVIERAAAFDRRFFKNHRNHPGYKSVNVGANVQRSKSRRASVGDEPCLLLARPPTAKDKGLSIGAALETCPMSTEDLLVPWIVVHCCNIIESKGLDVTGIYRVPGNSAAVQHLTQVVNVTSGKNVNLNDSKWADVNVVTSLLKSFFRLLPEPLLTSSLYHHFIAIDKIPDCRSRLGGIQALIQRLPPVHFETLRYFCMHLQRIAARSESNKMDSRNLSIVLGPTLVRSLGTGGQCSMLSMISDMQHQCHITETLINYADYLFYRLHCGEPSTVMNTLIDIDPLPSSSSSESLASRQRVKVGPFSRTLTSKLSLLPGTPTPLLSVKQKIMSFECGKPPVLEETCLSSSFPPSPSKTFPALYSDDPLSSLTGSVDDPMSMSYHERRVLAKEKAKVFEEETRAVLEKKAFGSREQKMSREQTERRWQEVKRQATLLTRDNSDDNIDKENQSSQNVEGCCLPSLNTTPESRIDERDSLRNSAAPPCNVEQKPEEVVMLRTRSGKNLHRGNRYGVVYSPNSSKILKSIVQSEERNREGSQRKKSRLERRHTIAGSHSHSQPAAEKGLNRTPSERKSKMHRSTT